jgi:hypothetical protein
MSFTASEDVEMPLRPLKENGQPKREDELTANEQRTRAQEIAEDEQMTLLRARRAAVDNAALDAYQRSQAGKR